MLDPISFPSTSLNPIANLPAQLTRIDHSYMAPNLLSSLEKDQGWHGCDMKFCNNMRFSIEVYVYDWVGMGNIGRKFFQFRLQNIAGDTPGGKKVD